MIKFIDKPYRQEELEEILHPYVREWFFSKFKKFSQTQLFGALDVHLKNNILVSAPTGSGKTLTAFLFIINELVNLADKEKLEDKVYSVYCSPLKALSRDIEVNLKKPLKEIEEIAKKHGKKIDISVGLRTGDTTAAEKAKMLRKTPHILVTTPESLAIMLGSPKFSEKLRSVDWCIVDEIHALAENKRGVHLSLTLERLNQLSPYLSRVGLSATIAPLEEIAKFLVGSRECKIADVSFLKKFDLKVISPLPDLINTTDKEMHKSLYNLIDNLIQEHKTTLIFTNTRAGTERVVHHLKDKFPKKYIENIGAHHGSLSKSHRQNIENSLREGKMKAVVCSTSLELGIDIGYIDLVICLGSPKSVARFLQRCLPYNSRILLADGTYKKIGEIVENKLDVKVLSYDKEEGFIENKIVRYHKNKAEKLLKIKLHSGLILDCTEEHPLLTRSGWKEAKNLNINEEVAELFDYRRYYVPYVYEMINQKEFYVENRSNFLRSVIDTYIKNNGLSYIDLARNLGIKGSHLQDYMRRKGRRKSIRLDIFLRVMDICGIARGKFLSYLTDLKSKSHHRQPLPLMVDRDIMWLSGIVASDGSITEHKKTKELKIKIGNKDKKLLEECRMIFNRFGFYPSILKSKNKNFYSLDCGSKLLAQIMLSLGIKKGKRKSYDIEVSDILSCFPRELAIPYLEGVLEGDGNKDSNIRLFTASRKFAVGIHNLLNKMGIYNYFIEQESKTSKLVRKINTDKGYCIYISRANHVKKFLRYCTLKGKKAGFLYSKRYNFGHHDRHIDDNVVWTKITSIDKIKERVFVYNITLENEPNNYFVESILTHNCGRAGHALHETVKGRMIVLDRDDLIECSVLLKAAIEKKIDRIHIPRNSLDVLAQQIYGLAIQRRWNIDELFELIKKSYCYSELKKEDFMEVLYYLAGNYASLEDRYIYAKIWIDEETGELGKKGKIARVIYMTNIGTIPDETFVQVKIGDETIGSIDEGFLERLKRGDIFVLGGSTYQFLFSRGMVAQVRAAAEKKPTVPSWFSEMLPLSFDLAVEIQKFRRYMEDKFVNNHKGEDIINFINEYLYVDENAARAIYNYFNEQYLYLEIPNDQKLLVEHYNAEGKKYVVFHSLYGRRVNDVLSRAVAYAVAKLQHKDVEIGLSDNGFYISYDRSMQVVRAFDLLKADQLRKVMDMAIDKSEVLKRRFRHCAGRALMILRQYKGKKKRVGRQQVSSMILMQAVKRISEDFSILKEARREVLEDLMDIGNASKVLKDINDGKIEVKEVHTNLPSPFAFNLVLQGYTDIMKMEEKLEFLRRMHAMVLAKIGKRHVINKA